MGQRGLSVVQSYCTRSVVCDHRRGYRLSCFSHSLIHGFTQVLHQGISPRRNGSESEKPRWWRRLREAACGL